jgi:hypothetical protein
LTGQLGLEDVASVEGELDTVKSVLETAESALGKVSKGDVQGAPEEV